MPTAEQRRRFDNLLLPTAPVVPIGAGSDSTVAAIEHNLDVIKSADWLIDLGPQGGDRSGILADGSPEDVACVPESSTGQFLTAALTVAGRLPAADGAIGFIDRPLPVGEGEARGVPAGCLSPAWFASASGQPFALRHAI